MSIMLEQLPLTFSYRSSYGRGDFLVAPCNQEAVLWIDKYPDWPVPAVIICGETGSGKSHLAAIFSQTRLNGSQLTDEIALNISASRIVVENIDMLRDEQALFYLYNRIVMKGGALLMTTHQVPHFHLKDLQSRMNAVPKIYISMPDDELMYAVFYKAFQERGLVIDPRVIEYTIIRVPRSFRAMQQVIEQADRLSLSRGQRITIPLMRTAIERAMEILSM